MNKFLFLIVMLSFFCAFTSNVKAYDPHKTDNNLYGISIINHSDLEDASNLVNSTGGEWGYVTIVITEKDRNKEVWQKFMDDCRRLHLIPIVRVASEFKDGNWSIPKTEGIDNWINFFNSLNWVIENRYLIIGNEPNHSKEWGGTINPSEYAVYLKTFAERLHNANSEYFVLNAGFDQDAPNSKHTMDEKNYVDQMVKEIPDIFNFIDGWNSHSYPNPAFSGSKNGTGRRSIKGYEWELSLIKRDLPVFITETGWIRNKRNNENVVSENIKYAFENVWSKDKKVVAVTPFVLNYTESPFYEFSWKNKDGSYFKFFETVKSIQKIAGSPKQKITGEVVFNFLNPLMIKDSEQKAFSIVKNTGQAVWLVNEANIISENSEIKISNVKFNNILPFQSGLVIYSLKSSESNKIFDTKIGLYIKNQKVEDLFNGKIISF